MSSARITFCRTLSKGPDMHIDEVKGVSKVQTRPAGNREFQGALYQSEKAVCVSYYGWSLWIPKKAVRRCNGALSAPLWAIEKAKTHEMKRKERLRYAAIAAQASVATREDFEDLSVGPERVDASVF